MKKFLFSLLSHLSLMVCIDIISFPIEDRSETERRKVTTNIEVLKAIQSLKCENNKKNQVNPARVGIKDEVTDNDCVICYEKINKFPKKLSCSHNQFHAQCFAKWLEEQATCPLCRHEL